MSRVFIIYDRRDQRWLQRLQVHLLPLQREGVIDLWDYTSTKLNSKWREEISGALASATVAVLLVTADFLASDFMATNELPLLLAEAESRGVTILALIISPCQFDYIWGLRGYQAFNSPSQPLVGMPRRQQEQILVRLSSHIEDALKTASAPYRPSIDREEVVWDLMLMRDLLAEAGGRKQARRTGSGGEPSMATDPVDCSVFAPSTVARGDQFLVQVFAHLPEQAERVLRLAHEADPEAERRGCQTLEVEVERGTQLVFTLVLSGLMIDESAQTLTWRGMPATVQFGVTVPPDLEGGRVIGTVTAWVAQVPVGHIKFQLKIMARADVPLILEHVGERAHYYRQAFISYASRDRAEVLKRAQMLALLGIPFFQDVLHLEPGQRWERELYRHIDEADLFLLFWSRAAKRSKWVLKEVHYAMARKGGDEMAPPAIVPVPIEGPPPVPPPDELKDLHCNDLLLYVMAAS